MKTYFAKPSEVVRKWYVIDAADLVLGRLSVVVANLLRGRNKPMYTPHIDTGDYVIIINADKVKMTSDKMNTELVYWHTNFPGGIKKATRKQFIARGRSDFIIRKSIKGMIPSGPLGYAQFEKLYVYRGAEHKHAAQKPIMLDISSFRKNKV